ncbi:MAG: hypothetical protein H6835_19175 [Planctomycetes bacterium]|nr:hypothetical protein [Planctomycetota bacterium]
MRLLPLMLLLGFAACASTPPPAGRVAPGVLVASLAVDAGGATGGGPAFAALRDAFTAANPGYDIAFHRACSALPPADRDRIVFVQGPADRTIAPTVGDALLVPAFRGCTFTDGAALDLLAFALPEPLPAGLPSAIRPDWDPRITDTPGGCATEDDAYRRILLTWRGEVGPYVLHQLNAHRVRINDSFTHYHPVDGGFDEFYLVQETRPGARLLTTNRVPEIEARTIDRSAAAGLLHQRELRVGDLVYLPRGTAHRGLGGAVVQVISVPGFVPGSEIGLDHHLWAINCALGLTGAGAIPFHLVAARTAVRR